VWIEQSTRDTLLTITRPNFDKKGRWGFAEGGAKFSAKMEDTEFLAQVKNREIPFLSGDIFRVRLRTEQTVEDDGKIKTSHTIEAISPYKQSPRGQLALKQPEDQKSSAGGRKFLPPSQE
jgi:hypothetical protein